MISQTYWCPKDWTNEGGTYLKSVGSASQEYIAFQWNLLYDFKPLPKKGWQNWKCSTYFPHIFSKFSSNFLQLFQMTKLDCFHHRSTNVCKNTVKVKAAFCSNEFLLCQECVIFWLHGFCVNQPCTCCGNVLETSHIWHLVCVCQEFLSHMSSSALSLGYGRLKAQKTKCHKKTCAFEQHRSIHAKTTGETVKRSYLLVLHQGLKQLHSKRAANWNRKKWKAWNKQVALQDPASTAAKSHSNLAFSVWTWVQYTWSKKALIWLYIEESALKHRVPAQPLHPACSNCHPAKRIGKHNTISVASSILTCNGLATQKRLASWR